MLKNFYINNDSLILYVNNEFTLYSLKTLSLEGSIIIDYDNISKI